MMSYDQNMQVVGRCRLVFEPYPDGTGMDMMDCNGGACFFDACHWGCGKCTDATRNDGRCGWWKEAT